MAGKRQTPCIRPPARACCTRATPSGAMGFAMKKPQKRSGWRCTASATESSSPGILAMSAAFATLYSSSSCFQAAARSSQEGGMCQSRIRPISSISSGGWPLSAASDAKNAGEKKWTCASQTWKSPHGVCIGFVPVHEAGRQGHLGDAGHIVDAQLLHEHLAVTAHRLETQVEEHRDVLAGLAFGHQAQHLQFAGRKSVQGGLAAGGPQIAALDAGQQAVRPLRAEVRPAAGHGPESVDQIRRGGPLEHEGARARADGAHHRILIVVYGEDDYAGLRRVAQDLNGGFDAVQTRQADIHDHQVGTLLLAELHRLSAAFGLADDAEFGGALQNRAEAVAHHLVIVHQQNIVCHRYLNRSSGPDAPARLRGALW